MSRDRCQYCVGGFFVSKKEHFSSGVISRGDMQIASTRESRLASSRRSQSMASLCVVMVLLCLRNIPSAQSVHYHPEQRRSGAGDANNYGH